MFCSSMRAGGYVPVGHVIAHARRQHIDYNPSGVGARLRSGAPEQRVGCIAQTLDVSADLTRRVADEVAQLIRYTLFELGLVRTGGIFGDREFPVLGCFRIAADMLKAEFAWRDRGTMSLPWTRRKVRLASSPAL